MKPSISHPHLPAPHDLHEVRDAARDLADQAGQAPGRPGTVFQKVTSVALVTTAVLSGATAAIHLWKSLFLRHQEKGHRAARPPAGEHGHAR